MQCSIEALKDIAASDQPRLPDAAGVYAIVNVQTGKAYIGQSVNLKVRFQQHRSALRANQHPNKALQEAWHTYGEDSFRMGVVALLDADSLIEAERELLDALWGDGLYNQVGGTPTTVSARVAKHAARKAEAGEVLVRIWTHADDADRLRAYAARLRKKRLK